MLVQFCQMKKGKKNLVDEINKSKEELKNLEEKADSIPSNGLEIFQNHQKKILGARLEKPPPMSYYVHEFKYNTMGPTNILAKNGSIPAGINLLHFSFAI